MLPSLLQWATANTDPSAPPAPPTMTNEEMRQWMGVLMKTDSDKMKENIAILTKEGATPAEREEALEELNALCESIDNACDLHKVGGLVPVLATLTDPSAVLRAKAAWLLATCAHNNPRVQRQLLDLSPSPLPVLLQLLSTDENGEVRAKALSALSGILKNNPVACDEFTRLNGWTTMARALQGNDLNFHRKLTFILTQFLQTSPAIKELLSDSQAIQPVLHLLEYSDPDLVEKALDLLQRVVADSPVYAAKWREAGSTKALEALKARIGGMGEEDRSAYDTILEKIAQLQQTFSKL
jgi:HEAT repeat protein